VFTKLTIQGLRGFQESQSISLAQPNGKLGSGLTVIVGANNSGKSTAIEALRALAQRDPPSFTQGRRNIKGGDKIHLKLEEINGNPGISGFTELNSISPSTSECTFSRTDAELLTSRLLVLPSRRSFEPFFSKSDTSRENYMLYAGFPTARTSSMSEFTRRLFAIAKNKNAFDLVLKKVVDPVPDWSIDQIDSGQYFLKVKSNDAYHSSEGMGEGLVSLLYIVDAIYDSEPEHAIAIDEPELSLHPALQRKLFKLIAEYSSDRQVIISTHSPYMIPIGLLTNGARILRVTTDTTGSRINQLSGDTASQLEKLATNANNPHILGLDAREIFFTEDKIVLFEGQEDIVFLGRIEKSLEIDLKAHLFGWGAGGAENMHILVKLLKELGFKKVAGILDGDKTAVRDQLVAAYPDYHFACIPTKDIRTKKAVKARDKVNGLLTDSNDAVRQEYAGEMRNLMIAANAYFEAVV